MRLRTLLPLLALVSCGKSSDKDDPAGPLQAVKGGCVYYGAILSPPNTEGPSSYGKQCITGQAVSGPTLYNFDKGYCDQIAGTFLDGGCPALGLAKCESNKDGVKRTIYLYESDPALSMGQTGQLEAFQKSCENSKEIFTQLK